MRCNRCREKLATRRVALNSAYVAIIREFCDDCTVALCTRPTAGVTNTRTGVRDTLNGTDLGPIPSEN